MKTLRRVFFYLLLSVGVLLIALVGSVFLFKDRIIKQFIVEANKHLSTPVKIGKIEVSVFEQFPQVSIVLNDVYVEDSQPGQYPLLTATKISFQMNPIEVWQGSYSIKGLKVENSETNLKIDRKGDNNYQVVKSDGSKGQSSIGFELKDVKLINTVVHYTDIRLNQDFDFTSKDLVASIKTNNDLYAINGTGQLTTEKISINNNLFLGGKAFSIKADLVYDDARKFLQINPSTLELRKAKFLVSGTYDWKTKNIFDITTKGENTDIQTLISLFPESVSKKLEQYESSGEVYFNSHLKGELSKAKNPSFTVNFGFNDATVFHPGYKSRIEDASFEGSYATSDLSDLRNATLILKNISGKLNNESFQAQFVMQNLVDPSVIMDFKGKVDAPSLLSFYPVEELQNVSGAMVVDVSFEGKLSLLKTKSTAQKVSTQGTVDLLDISLDYGKEKIPMHHLNGNLQFNNNDLALSNVSGTLGNSDFVLNGFFKNVITFILFENQPIGIEADLQSRFIDLDQMFAITFGNSSEGSGQEYTFSISKNVSLNFNCDIKALRYKKFHSANLKGDLLVKNEMAVSRKFSLQTMGGSMELSGIVDAKNRKAIDLVTTAKFQDIHLDSAFYVFENFQQNFIEDRHLKGQASADVTLELTVDQHLKMFPETLIADIGATIKNGQLNNFEPMKKLNRYLDDEGLSKLRFSELKNDIHIENKTVYIPLMEIRSNVTNLSISGTHTFDQHIDYRVVTPLRRKKPKEPEAQLAIEEDAQGGAKLFLKITGTTDDYRIQYDTEAVRKKIASDFKKEVKELKDAFKTKGKQKQKEVELEEDDYFDW
ncbi:MAG TPA: AsmA-like C-terminal region-containing protein [Chryseosolibacter sp.]